MTKRASTTPSPSIHAIVGDDGHKKSTELKSLLDQLLPEDVDRGLALVQHDGSAKEEQGGTTLAEVMDDLTTLPFLVDRRVVLIRDADRFISTHREPLERYVAKPAPTATLILVARSLPLNTNLGKAIRSLGGYTKCERPKGRELHTLVSELATEQHGKRISPAATRQLVDLIGPDPAMLVTEIGKLATYVGDRQEITDRDVSDLVGQTREEKIFAVLDHAAVGRLPEAIRLWQQTLQTDPEAVYKCVGGVAFCLRRWLDAQDDIAAGMSPREAIQNNRLWGRELDTILQRLPATQLRRALSALAKLDTQAKSGLRSIETGVESLLIRLAASARR